MKDDDLIHVQFEHEELTQSKKDILSSEMNLLKIKSIMREYSLLREEELKTKLKLYRNMKEMMGDINKLQKILPQVQVPNILKKETETKEEFKRKIIEKKETPEDKKIEEQLREIQEKLRSLEG